MTTKTRNKDRAPGQTTITVPLEKTLKNSLRERAMATRAQLAMADLVRLAIMFQEENNWKDIPEAHMRGS